LRNREKQSQNEESRTQAFHRDSFKKNGEPKVVAHCGLQAAGDRCFRRCDVYRGLLTTDARTGCSWLARTGQESSSGTPELESENTLLSANELIGETGARAEISKMALSDRLAGSPSV